MKHFKVNLFLTEHRGCSREYWPEVVAVRSEASKLLTKTREGNIPHCYMASSASEQDDPNSTL